MYSTLELGMAGTKEWLAASKNMTILNDSYFGLTCYDGEIAQVRKLGFLSGQFSIPEDFDQIGSVEIGEMFDGEA